MADDEFDMDGLGDLSSIPNFSGGLSRLQTDPVHQQHIQKQTEIKQQPEEIKHLQPKVIAKEEKKQEIKPIELKNKNGTGIVKIHPFGATVISWIVDDEEQLFVSSKAIWNQSKAIRGGIPLVFPQFGPGKMKQHGFARVSLWKIDNIDNDKGIIILSLNYNNLSEEWKKQFPYKFTLKYKVEIKQNNDLYTELIINNDDKEKSFDFTVLFHTYFNVNSKNIKIKGLNGLNYDDTIEKNNRIKKEGSENIGISSEVDRVYLNINDNDIVLIDDTKKIYKKIIIKRHRFFKDVVVWNPWIDKSKRMSDFDDDEYKNMVCIEAGSVAKPVTLNCGSSWIGTQTLTPSK